jgi:ribosomal protein S27E
MRTQELLINKELEGIKNLLMQRGGDVDPNKAAVDNVKNLALLISTVKSLSPEPPAAPVTANSGELAFKYQDRQWQHEEKKIEAEIKKQEIAASMHVEQQKLEQSKNNLAQIPEMIGAVVAQSFMESSKNKSAAPSVQAAPNKEPFSIKLSKSKEAAHGPITIKCPDCKSDVSFMTSAKRANCINCGLVFNIQLLETEGGPTSVESDQPEPQPTQERPPADGYLYNRGL